MNPTLELAKALIERPSVTPDDAGCQELLIDRLEPLGFHIERIVHGKVTNLWARRGENAPLLVFAGHTDVVPSGDETAWATPPFTPTERDGYLYGRGAADMKTSLAAMVTAVERFVNDRPAHGGSIGLLITSDEEGDAVDGTVKVIETLKSRGETIDWCVVGEPSSSEALGDVIKHGRRGSLSGQLRVIGQQGHVAYPHLADNPVHGAAAALAELCSRTWDAGNAHFPPTTFQISNIHAGTGAGNVIPGTLDVSFNFRYSTEIDEQALRREVEALLDRHRLDYRLDWSLSGRPFLTADGELLSAVENAVETVTGQRPTPSTAGGTSDGRFIAPTGAQVVELGPVNATIHKVNECVRITDLEPLSRIYQTVLQTLLSDAI